MTGKTVTFTIPEFGSMRDLFATAITMVATAGIAGVAVAEAKAGLVLVFLAPYAVFLVVSVLLATGGIGERAIKLLTAVFASALTSIIVTLLYGAWFAYLLTDMRFM